MLKAIVIVGAEIIFPTQDARPFYWVLLGLDGLMTIGWFAGGVMALSRNIRGIWFGFIVAVCSIVTTLLVIIAMTDGRFGPWVLAPVLQAIVLTPGVNLILVIVLKKAFESVIAEDQANRLLEATPAAQQAAVAMDFIRTECSTCGRAVRIKAGKIGKQFKCPGCGTVHTVPGS